MDTGEDPERGRPSPSYPIYDRSGVTGAAESFGQQTSDVLGTLSLLSTASGASGSGSTRLPPTVPSLDADHARLAKQSHVDTIMSSVDAMREELGRSPKDLATAACQLIVWAFVRVLGGFAPKALSGRDDFNVYTPEGLLARTIIEKGGGQFALLEQVAADGSGWGLKNVLNPNIAPRGSLGVAGYDQILAKVVEGYFPKPLEASDIQNLIDQGHKSLQAAAAAAAAKAAAAEAAAARVQSEQLVQREVGNSLAGLSFGGPSSAMHAAGGIATPSIRGDNWMGAARK